MSVQKVQKNETGIKVIPPIVFLIALGLAFLADWFWPIRMIRDGVQYGFGAAIILVSFALLPAALGGFKRAKTSFDVRRKASVLITDGPFRFSRNPIYVSMIALCIGIGVAADNIWVFPAVMAAVVFLFYTVIAVEERHLEAEFGEDYRTYKRRVRRWI